VHPDGTVTGGPAAVLRCGLHNRFAAGCFSVCCVAAALGMGNLAQSSTIAQTALSFGIPLPCTALLTALLLAGILRGGRNRIGAITEWLMPLLCCGYLLGCGIIICLQIRALPNVLVNVFREAFGFRSAGAGFCAYLLLQNIRTGFCRGIFSNEAGLGSSPLLHLDAPASQAAKQGEWAAAEVFADTMVSCTATALVILTAPVSAERSSNASALLLQAFSTGLGSAAHGFLGICMILLAFATMLGWYKCGLTACRDLIGKHASSVFPFCYLLAAFAGALGNPAWVWTLCDCTNGMMALPNLYALLRLGGLQEAEQKKVSAARQFDKF
jgi:AGCS family alanine or glycine:cation symporter